MTTCRPWTTTTCGGAAHLPQGVRRGHRHPGGRRPAHPGLPVLAAAAPRFRAGRRLLVITELLAQAAGYRGMVGGQMLDMLAEGRRSPQRAGADPSLQDRGPCSPRPPAPAPWWAAATGGGGRPDQLRGKVRPGFSDYRRPPGRGGDHRGDRQGRRACDEKRQKATYPALVGLEASRQRARRLVEEAVAALEPFRDGADPLRDWRNICWCAGLSRDCINYLNRLIPSR